MREVLVPYLLARTTGQKQFEGCQFRSDGPFYLQVHRKVGRRQQEEAVGGRISVRTRSHHIRVDGAKMDD